jgi:hypothetical protein
MPLQPDEEKRTIVFVGKFNPDIFHPAWFLNQGLIFKADYEKAEVKLVHPDLSQVTLPGMTLVITRDRFQLVSTQPPYYPFMRDLAVHTFTHLSHSIVTALGINSHAVFTLETKEQWHSFGHFLAPKAGVWDDILDEPGMAQITIRGNRELGARNVTVQPLEEKRILIKVNDHFDVLEAQTESALKAVEILNAEWENSERAAVSIFENLTGKAINSGK